MEAIVGGAALVLVAAGLVAGAVAALATRDWRAALGVALELWLAAGLLRLAGTVAWDAITAAAAVVAVRRVVGRALRRDQASTTKRASTSAPPGVSARSGSGSSPGSATP